MTGDIMTNVCNSEQTLSLHSKSITLSKMSDTSTNSATSGYLKGNNPQKESKTLFLDTEKTVAIREGSIVSVPEVLGGKPLEGRVIFIGDKPSRGLDGRKLSRYFTVCYNEDTLGALLVFDFEWQKVEVINF